MQGDLGALLKFSVSSMGWRPSTSFAGSGAAMLRSRPTGSGIVEPLTKRRTGPGHEMKGKAKSCSFQEIFRLNI